MREVLGVFILLCLVWFHYRATEGSFLKSFYLPAIFIKLCAGVGVGLLYTYYYNGGDTWNYFNQAMFFSKIAFSSMANFSALFVQSKYELIDGFAFINQPRAALMVKVVAIVNVLTNSNYWLTSLYFSFFSFVGVYKFSAWVVHKFEYGKVAALMLFLWPSFVFWSSGLLKETIAVGLIFWIVPTFFEWQELKSAKKLLKVLVGLYLLFLIKYYFAVVLFVVLLLYTIASSLNLSSKSLLHQIAIWVIMLIVGLGLGGLVHPNLNFENILGVMIQNNHSFIAISSPQNIIIFYETSRDWLWFLINMPKALFSSLFLPLTFGRGTLSIFASLENWALIALVIRGVLTIKFSELRSSTILLLASFSYIFILAVFLALSTPNLGTLSRYKVAFIPIVLVLVIIANKFNYFDERK